jgi:glycosyltransferase involved in cell wall biosynthesis
MARILVVTNIFPPLIGGPATFADRLGHVLAGRGHDVTVVCSSDQASDPGDRSRPFRVRRVSLRNRYLYEVNVRATLVQTFLRHHRILVIGLEGYVLDVVRLIPRRYILRVPGDTVWESARNYGVSALRFDAFQEAKHLPPLVEAIARKREACLSRASIVITPSHHLETVVRRWPGVPRALRTIQNGVMLGDYPQRTVSPRVNRPLVALFASRLTNAKGVETILLAARDLPGVHVEIAGDGPEFPLMTTLHAQLGAPGHIVLLGRLTAEELRQRMLAADVFLLPSDHEGMSHALLEACAAGLVPLVSDCGGNREIIADGENGLLHPYGDPAALRAALKRLEQDDALRIRLSEAARATAARFPFERTVDAYVELLESGAD